MTSLPPVLLSGTGHPALAGALACALGIDVSPSAIARFPDGEIHLAVRGSLRGHDVYLLQPTGPPAERHLLELLLLGDACRRAGAARVTGVIPYFGYARQDRRANGRESVGARLIADLLATGGIDHVVAVDLHATALEGFFSMPVEHLTAVPLLAAALEQPAEHSVVVAPDLGAARLADRYARALSLPVAIVHKTRRSGTEVAAGQITGDVRGLAPIIVDDMISTGGTIEAAVRAVRAAGARPDLTVIATHLLPVPGTTQRLLGLGLTRLLVTDSLPQQPPGQLPQRTVSLAPLLADALNRLHTDASLASLLVHE